MAVTVTVNHSDFDYQASSAKAQKVANGTLVFDASYVTNGEPCDWTSTSIMTGDGGAFTTIHEVQLTVQSVTAADAGYQCTYDPDNKKLMLFEAASDGGPLDEAANAVTKAGVIVAWQVSGV